MRTELNLSKYIFESESALQQLVKSRQQSISSLDLQLALAEVLGYSEDESTRVADHQLTAKQMLEVLKDYEFVLPMELGEIVFEASILPEGVPVRLDEKEIKDRGEIWVIHKYDKDPFPSDPHAHNKATGYKLHLGNGELYSHKNDFLGASIPKKHLIDLRNKAKGIQLPPLTI